MKYIKNIQDYYNKVTNGLYIVDTPVFKAAIALAGFGMVCHLDRM